MSADSVNKEVFEALFELERIEPVVRAKIFEEIKSLTIQKDDRNEDGRDRSDSATSFICEADMMEYINSQRDFGVVTPRIEDIDDNLKYEGASILLKTRKVVTHRRKRKKEGKSC